MCSWGTGWPDGWKGNRRSSSLLELGSSLLLSQVSSIILTSHELWHSQSQRWVRSQDWLFLCARFLLPTEEQVWHQPQPLNVIDCHCSFFLDCGEACVYVWEYGEWGQMEWGRLEGGLYTRTTYQSVCIPVSHHLREHSHLLDLDICIIVRAFFSLSVYNSSDDWI